MKRKYHIGAELVGSKGVHFRVWAPDHQQVDLVIEDQENGSLSYAMEREDNGYYSLFVKGAAEGTVYSYKLSESEQPYADPASRFQPAGPLGPSAVVSPSYPWTDKDWTGVTTHGHVIYELHVGTFTEEGTYTAAAAELPRLKDLGITLIEILPLADFPGHFGWGYDGVNLFAPTHLYGSPADLKGFINMAHSLGLGVVLDVVYNHLGPGGNTMLEFSKGYLSSSFSTDWGPALNFDNPESRAFFLANARYWIEEFHFDGLRIDATPWMFCSTPVHILADLSRVVHEAGVSRQTIIIGENEPQDTTLLRSYEDGGYDFDMLWNDDFHHAAMVRLTGKREAYCQDYLGSPQEFISAVKYGYLYQGQYYSWQKQQRGSPSLDISPESFVVYLENHDQVANLGGLRLHQTADPGNYKTMTALLLLGPSTPMIFQGQEFSSNRSFYYFADHSPDLSPLVRRGRKRELSQFPRLATKEMRDRLPDPENPLTFTKSKLNPKEMDTKIYCFFSDLIELRKKDPVFRRMHEIKIDGAQLGNDCFLLRYFGEQDGDRLLLINFGADYHFDPAPEPLLAAPRGCEFELHWSSESVQYAGAGTPPIMIPSWKLLGHSAVLLKTKRKS